MLLSVAPRATSDVLLQVGQEESVNVRRRWGRKLNDAAPMTAREPCGGAFLAVAAGGSGDRVILQCSAVLGGAGSSCTVVICVVKPSVVL